MAAEHSSWELKDVHVRRDGSHMHGRAESIRAKRKEEETAGKPLCHASLKLCWF